MRIRLFTHYISVIIVLFILWSCTNQHDDMSSIVRIQLEGEPTTLDPSASTAELLQQISRTWYDTLIELQEDGTFSPALATSWVFSADAMRLDIVVRKDVYFHDGSLLTSADVIASLERLRSGKQSAYRYNYEFITDIYAQNDYELTILFTEPGLRIEALLAHASAAIVPHDAIERGHNFARNPIGTGAYMFERYDAGVALYAKHSKQYWRARGEQQHIVYQIITDTALAQQALISGSLEVITAMSYEEYEYLSQYKHINAYMREGSRVFVIALNHEHEPFNDLHMRKAIALAIDKQRVLTVAYGGGTVVNSFIAPSHPYYIATEGYEYNPELARLAVRQTAYNNEILDMVVPNNYQAHIDAAQLYQQMLKEVGIFVRIRHVDWATWLDSVYGDAAYDLTVIAHTSYIDPAQIFAGYGEAGSRYIRYDNTEIRDLLVRGQKMMNIVERRDIYARVQRIMAADLPFVFIGVNTEYFAVNANITGFYSIPILQNFDVHLLTKTT